MAAEGDGSTGSSSAASEAPRGSWWDQRRDPAAAGSGADVGLARGRAPGRAEPGVAPCETSPQGEGGVSRELSRCEEKEQRWGSRRSTAACSFPPDAADFASAT